MAYSWERLTPEEKEALLEGIESGTPLLPPRVVEISWQDRCNIDCFFCSTAEVRAGGFEISRERLLTLFDEMRGLGVRAARLTGGGEPLFRRDAAELIGELGKRGIRVADVTTNAVLLTEPVVRALYAAGCDEIHVSLNTADADSYAAMMQTSPRNFDRVLENVRRAARIKREMRSECRLKLQFLIYADNFRQIPAMRRVFEESEADTFWFNGLFPVRPMPAMSDADVDEMLQLYEELLAEDGAGPRRDPFDRFTGFSFWERDIAERIADSTRRALRRAPLPRRIGAAAGRIRKGVAARRLARLHEFCLIGWYATSINANGDVVPCCILQDRKTAVLGNIRRSTLEEIWEGAEYARFRRELRAIMGNRGGEVPAGACVVEDVCVKKELCPNRSFYWADDAPFRRRFHRLVEGLTPSSSPLELRPVPAAAAMLPTYQGNNRAGTPGSR